MKRSTAAEVSCPIPTSCLLEARTHCSTTAVPSNPTRAPGAGAPQRHEHGVGAVTPPSLQQYPSRDILLHCPLPPLPGCLPSTQETRDFTTQPRQD